MLRGLHVAQKVRFLEIRPDYLVAEFRSHVLLEIGVRSGAIKLAAPTIHHFFLIAMFLENMRQTHVCIEYL